MTKMHNESRALAGTQLLLIKRCEVDEVDGVRLGSITAAVAYRLIIQTAAVGKGRGLRVGERLWKDCPLQLVSASYRGRRLASIREDAGPYIVGQACVRAIGSSDSQGVQLYALMPGPNKATLGAFTSAVRRRNNKVCCAIVGGHAWPEHTWAHDVCAGYWAQFACCL
jgi:hypothetical protein